MSHSKLFWIPAVLLIAGIAFASIPAGASPQPPAAYYGQAIINGEPAPAGVEITAKINGSVRGTIKTDSNGTFGAPGMLDEKLDVNGSADDERELVTFEVGNKTANTSLRWSSGDHRQLTLSVSNGTCVRDAVSGKDGLISLTEIQRAINWWAKGYEVPITGGDTISLSKIQSLINSWAEGTTVSCS